MNVKFFAMYRMIVGQGCINLPAPRDGLELLEILAQRYPDFQGLLLNDDHTDKGRDAIVLASCWCAAAISSIWMACAPRFPSRIT